MNVPPEILRALGRIHADLGATIADLSAPEPHLPEMRLGVIARQILAQEEMLSLEKEPTENVIA